MLRHSVSVLAEQVRAQSSFDVRSLAAFRAGVALVTLLNLACRLPYLRAFHSHQGPFPPFVALAQDWASLTWCFHVTNTTVAFQALLVAVHAALAICLLVGLRTRAVCMLLYLFTISLNNANRLILSAGDELLELTLFWMMFLPVGQSHSVDLAVRQVDGGRAQSAPRQPVIWSLATFGWTVNVTLVYWFAALWKTSPHWLQGSAVFYALNIGQMASRWAPYVVSCRWLMVAFSRFAVYWEALGPMLLWSPVCANWLRLLTVLTFVGMHAGFGLFLHIGIFTWVPMACQLAFLPSTVWNWLAAWFVKGRADRRRSVVFLLALDDDKSSGDDERVAAVQPPLAPRHQRRVQSIFVRAFACLCLAPATRVVTSRRHARPHPASARVAEAPAQVYRRRADAHERARGGGQAAVAPLFADLPEASGRQLAASCSASRMRELGVNMCVAVWNEDRHTTVVRYGGADAWPELVRLSALLGPVRHLLTPPLFRYAQRRLWSTLYAILSDLVGPLLPAEAAPPPPHAQPAHQHRRRMFGQLFGGLRSAAVLFFTLYVIAWNVAGFAKVNLPADIGWIGPAFRIKQFWGMFSPGPAPFSQWPLVTGTLRNGTSVDLWAGGDVEWRRIRPVPANYYSTRPSALHQRFASHRWQRAVMSFSAFEMRWALDQYLGYACRQWNLNGVAAEAGLAAAAAEAAGSEEAHRRAIDAFASRVQLVSVKFELASQLTPDPFAQHSFGEAARMARTGPVSVKTVAERQCFASGDGAKALPGGAPEEVMAHPRAASAAAPIPTARPLSPAAPVCRGAVEFYIASFSERTAANAGPDASPLLLRSAARSRVCDREFRILLYPRGESGTADRCSVFVDFSEELESKPAGYQTLLAFDVTVVNALHPERSVSGKEGEPRAFSRRTPNWGFVDWLSLEAMTDVQSGFLVNDVLTVRLNVHIFQ